MIGIIFAACALAVAAVFAAVPAARDGLPRPVTPRGEFGGDERETIGLFERTRDSVVFITTREQVRDFWSRNVFSVQRGSARPMCAAASVARRCCQAFATSAGSAVFQSSGSG